jgi:tetratricopeptide (TPR) repeat protein
LIVVYYAAIDGNAVAVLLTAVGTVIVTLGTIALWRLTQRSQQQHDIEQAINAQIANHLHQFLDLSEKSRSLAERTEAIQREADEIQRLIRGDRRQIAQDRKELVDLQEQLNALRDRWGRLVPTMESIEGSPELLRITARQKIEAGRLAASPEEHDSATREATAFLRRLLQHPDAESQDLELGGDLARTELRMPALARQLYEKAVEADASNVSAQAELMALRVRRPSERDEALQELLDLIERHPEVKNARFSLFNHFIDQDRYRDLAEICRRLVEKDQSDATAWRNLGVALKYIEGDTQETRDAFEKAVMLSRKNGEIGDLANTARAYSGLLTETGSKADLERSRDLLEEALRESPLDSTLHSSMGGTLLKMGDAEQATHYYEVAVKLGTPIEAQIAGRHLQEIKVLAEVGLLGEMQADSPPM